MIRFLCVISGFAFNSIIIAFLYANICIICDFHKCFDFFAMLFIFKFSFHYLFIIKYDFMLCSISKVLVFKKLLFVPINIRSIISFFKLNLHFIFKKPLIFFINVIIIMLIFFLFINVIIFFFFINILMIIDIVFFVKYDAHDNIDLLIISIDFLCLKYHFDEFLLNSYI